MYVCICNAITDKQIRTAAASGVKDLHGLQAKLGVATGCGSCGDGFLQNPAVVVALDWISSQVDGLSCSTAATENALIGSFFVVDA